MLESKALAGEIKNPCWVHCGNCDHEWVLFWTPISANQLKKFKSICPLCCEEKKVFMGRKPRKIEARDGESDQQKITRWLFSHDTGISSKALAAEFMGTSPDISKFWPSPPRDPQDLGRCLRLIDLVPDVRKCVDALGQKNSAWAKAAAIWDKITESMIEEVGIDWSKGQSAGKTYDLMKAGGL